MQRRWRCWKGEVSRLRLKDRERRHAESPGVADKKRKVADAVPGRDERSGAVPRLLKNFFSSAGKLRLLNGIIPARQRRSHEAQFEAFASGVDAKPGIEGRGETSGVGEDDVQLIVGAIGVMMEEEEMFDPCFGGLTNHGVDTTVAPADSGGVFLGRVLGVVDQDIDPLDQGADLAVALEGEAVGPR